MEHHHHHDPQHHHQPSFQDGVTEIMMACEELRQPFKTTSTTTTALTADIVVNGRDDLDVVFGKLGGLHHQLQQQPQHPQATALPPDQVQLQQDLFQHCQQRVAQVAQLVLERIMTSPEPQEDEEAAKTIRQQWMEGGNEADARDRQAQLQQQLEADRREFQSSLARITELNFVLCLETSPAAADARIAKITDDYVAFQRNALRERAKPSIARLVQERREYGAAAVAAAEERMPHSNVVTVILGQASALIHPLLAWMFSLPPPPLAGGGEPVNPLVEAIRKLCGDSVAILDEQAQALTKTVSDWFWVDRKVDEWMAKSNQAEHDNSSSDNNDNNNGMGDNHKLYLGELDGLVEEMAFVCQVLARYQVLVQDVPPAACKLQVTIAQELSPEWTWKYSSLERFLATQQWKSALTMATPVNIILGTSIQVPSVVEDAQYLSTRALERAASTQSSQAIGTVAHSISSFIWSTDVGGGVHQALVDQVGCFVDESTVAPPESQQSNKSKAGANSNDFASALLDALDDDISDSHTPPPSQRQRAPKSGPSSGGLFQSLVGGGDAFQQLRMNTEFCNLNGIYSASTACRSLVKFLDGLLDAPEADSPEEAATTKHTNAMIQLAREELSQYEDSYERMLKAQVEHAIGQWCGSLNDPPKRKNCPCIPALRNYYLEELFELDQSSFKKAEADERLERELLGPLRDAKFLQQSPNKFEAEVLATLCEKLTLILVELVLDCLLHAEYPKRFTDWGSLLLSKQVRMLQQFLTKLQETSSSGNSGNQTRKDSNAAYQAWERLSQVTTVLQLERPSDWSIYQPTSLLSADELRSAMRLRVDFSIDAINAVAGPENAGKPNGGNGNDGQNGTTQL